MTITRESPARTIGEALNGHNNSFGVIRLGLAAVVVFSHGFPLGGWGEDPTSALSGHQSHIGTIAVLGFFAISGYVVTKSAANTDVMQYLWRRALRIFPAFWLVLLAGAFLLGPIVWMTSGHELGSYFTTATGGPFSYITSNWRLQIYQYGILDVFAGNPQSAINGSLWSLSYEWTAYLLIGALAVFGAMKRLTFVIPGLTIFFFVLEILTVTHSGGSPWYIMEYLGPPKRVPLFLIFLIGATFAQFSKRVPFTDAAGIGSLVIVLVTLWKGGFLLFGLPALTYGIIWLAARLPKRLQAIGQRSDYSYGLYLYGWPALQIAAILGIYRWGYVPFTLISLVLALGCAWLSWHSVERWALQLKGHGPGKGIAYWWARMRRTAPERVGPPDGATT